MNAPAAGFVPVVLLRPTSLLDPATLLPIAELGDDGVWRGVDGVPIGALLMPAPGLVPQLDAAAAREHMREATAAWVEHELDAVRRLATERATLTSEDVRAALATEPPDARGGLSALMRAAQRRDLITLTDEQRRTRRAGVGGRLLRVWKSLIYGTETSR